MKCSIELDPSNIRKVCRLIDLVNILFLISIIFVCEPEKSEDQKERADRLLAHSSWALGVFERSIYFFIVPSCDEETFSRFYFFIDAIELKGSFFFLSPSLSFAASFCLFLSVARLSPRQFISSA